MIVFATNVFLPIFGLPGNWNAAPVHLWQRRASSRIEEECFAMTLIIFAFADPAKSLEVSRR